MRQISYLLLTTFLILPTLALADDDPPQDPCKIQISGYIEGSYNYLVRSNKFTSGVYDRLFDIEPNGFTLQQLATTIALKPPKGLGFLVNLIMGRDANQITPYGLQPFIDSQTLTIDLFQTYLQYAIGPVTVIGGLFATLAGAEVVDPTEAMNFSRSLLDTFATPFSHFGVRVIYAANNKLTLTTGFNDGWDNVRDFSRRKTIELGMAYKFNSLFTLEAQGYSGGQRAADRTASGPESIRDLIDIVATIEATDDLSFIADYDYAIQGTAALPGHLGEAVWQGLAAYANYTFSESWEASLRSEIFADRNGYRTGVAQNLKEITLTLGYSPIKNLELRAETRHDFSNVNSFANRGAEGANANQQSYALEGFYKFT
jgi:hypothetical protein